MIEDTMKRREDCVLITTNEYRELVRAQKDAECLKAMLAEKLRWVSSIPYEEVKAICTMFGVRRDYGEAE